MNDTVQTAEPAGLKFDTQSALPPEETERLGTDIVAALKTVFDPEIPADIYELGLIYKVLMAGAHLWHETPKALFGRSFPNASVAAEISPELLGVGYIVGLRVGGIMLAGGVLSYLVLIPMITFFGSTGDVTLYPGTIPIAKMGIAEIRNAYVLYIGAGAVAAGGIISMARSMPTIVGSLRKGFGGMGKASEEATQRTDREIPIKVVFLGALAVIVAACGSGSLLGVISAEYRGPGRWEPVIRMCRKKL